MTEETLTIRTEKTPNPNSLKYNVGRMLVPGGSANFPTPESAELRSPLAKKLFAVKGIEGVFLGADFFTITRKEGVSWAGLNAGIAPALEEFFESGQPALKGKPEAPIKNIETDASDELVERVKQLLEEKVRPAVAQDGGDIIFRGIKDGVVYLEMFGACSGCPSSSITLKNGVETMLKHYCPEIKAVEEV